MHVVRWIKTRPALIVLGLVHKSNPQNFDTLPSKAYPTLGLPTIDTLEAYAAEPLGICSSPDDVGWCSHHHPCHPMPASEALGFVRPWLLQPGMVPKKPNVRLCC